MKTSCIIVDDEKIARVGLKRMLESHGELRVLKSCSNGLDAIDSIVSLRPDLVFLDVQMPGINGFEVLLSVSEPKPQVIFVTAYDQFAIRAFEANAIDYLLKPYTDDRLFEAIRKATVTIAGNQILHKQSLDQLLSSAKESLKSSTKLISHDRHEEYLIVKADGYVNKLFLDQISYVEAFDYYVKIFVNDKFYLVRDTMKNMDASLPQDKFIRIHKSTIINRNMIAKWGIVDGSFEVQLDSGLIFKVGRSYQKEVKLWLDAQ